jgi:nanoRNase/pAp phosphatase (c-di-AMP/oligoRNAs hydrolase)
LKSLSRLSLYEAGEVIIAIVKVGSFQASIAKFLVGAGCDIVIAYGKEDSLLKGSIRCSNELGRNDLVTLNVLAETIGKTFNGVGGGHRLASSFNVQYDESKFISTVLDLTQNMLSTKIRKLPLK